ncbi:ATP-binding protein, partial [Staphylococcus sp. SIMBA_130]
VRKDIFKRGVSTKGEQNRGFGLAIVKQIVDELNGTIELQIQNSGGVAFTIFIPKEVKNVV